MQSMPVITGATLAGRRRQGLPNCIVCSLQSDLGFSIHSGCQLCMMCKASAEGAPYCFLRAGMQDLECVANTICLLLTIPAKYTTKHC